MHPLFLLIAYSSIYGMPALITADQDTADATVSSSNAFSHNKVEVSFKPTFGDNIYIVVRKMHEYDERILGIFQTHTEAMVARESAESEVVCSHRIDTYTLV